MTSHVVCRDRQGGFVIRPIIGGRGWSSSKPMYFAGDNALGVGGLGIHLSEVYCDTLDHKNTSHLRRLNCLPWCTRTRSAEGRHCMMHNTHRFVIETESIIQMI